MTEGEREREKDELFTSKQSASADWGERDSGEEVMLMMMMNICNQEVFFEAPAHSKNLKLNHKILESFQKDQM